MLFNTLQFAIFFAALLAVHRSCPPRYRGPFLLGCSLIFYLLWIPVYLLLFLGDIALNYGLLRVMLRSSRQRPYVVLACVMNLGLLGVFKYAAFFVEALLPVSQGLMGVSLPIPDILLPLGISFFSFQILALTIDCYRGRVEEIRSFGEYALFVAFFPQLIAGPILRGHEFLPQLRQGGQISGDWNRRGIWLIASGLGKKVIMADFLLAPFVDRVFDMPGRESAAVHLIAVYSFAFQIYFDFSGYTDIARGMARLLGFELPLNFREPYLSRNPAEFWRRWHITLSRWLRDYLYISLGGNRRGAARTYVNLLTTMTLGGLWHGAGWNFLIWGALHGLFLVVHRKWRVRPTGNDESVSWRDAWRIVACFHAVCFLWIFFRAGSFEDARIIVTQIATGNWLTAWPILQSGIILLCAALHVAERVVRTHLQEIQDALSRPLGGVLEGAAIGAVCALAILLGAAAGGEFIYFQF